MLRPVFQSSPYERADGVSRRRWSASFIPRLRVRVSLSPIRSQFPTASSGNSPPRVEPFRVYCVPRSCAASPAPQSRTAINQDTRYAFARWT